MAYGPTSSLGLRGWTSPAPHQNGKLDASSLHWLFSNATLTYTCTHCTVVYLCTYNFKITKKDNKNLTQIMQSNSSHFWYETMAVLLVHKQCYKTDKLHTRTTHCHQQNTWHWKLWFSVSKLWQLITQLHNRMTREATKYYPTFPDLLNSLTLPKFPGY